jgi:hypothetical protein
MNDSTLANPPSGTTSTERKNMSYTYAWFYQPLAPVKLP